MINWDFFKCQMSGSLITHCFTFSCVSACVAKSVANPTLLCWHQFAVTRHSLGSQTKKKGEMYLSCAQLRYIFFLPLHVFTKRRQAVKLSLKVLNNVIYVKEICL